MIATIKELDASMPSLRKWGNKVRSDAQFVCQCANKLNADFHAEGESIGVQPSTDFSGLEVWPIKLDAEGNPRKFSVIAASKQKSEVSEFADSLREALAKATESAE